MIAITRHPIRRTTATMTEIMTGIIAAIETGMRIGCIRTLAVTAIAPMFSKAVNIAGLQKCLTNSKRTSIEQRSEPNANNSNPEDTAATAINLAIDNGIVSSNIRVVSAKQPQLKAACRTADVAVTTLAVAVRVAAAATNLPS